MKILSGSSGMQAGVSCKISGEGQKIRHGLFDYTPQIIGYCSDHSKGVCL